MAQNLLGFLIVSVLALLPLARLLRGSPASLGRRDASLAIQRQRLREVDRDRAAGLIGAEEHKAAQIEIGRRLLAEADAADDAGGGAGGGAGGCAGGGAGGGARRAPIVLTLVAVPLGAAVLYMIGGHPGMAPDPLGARIAAAAAAAREAEASLAALRATIAALPAASPQRRVGNILLGEADAAASDWSGAAAAFSAALAEAPFDPSLAIEAAEAQSRADGRVDAASLALFRRALAAAPPDAPWRTLAAERIAQGEHDARAAAGTP